MPALPVHNFQKNRRHAAIVRNVRNVRGTVFPAGGIR